MVTDAFYDEMGVAIATLLLKAGASLDESSKVYGGTPMDWAKQYNKGTLIKLFKEYKEK